VADDSVACSACFRQVHDFLVVLKFLGKSHEMQSVCLATEPRTRFRPFMSNYYALLHVKSGHLSRTLWQTNLPSCLPSYPAHRAGPLEPQKNTGSSRIGHWLDQQLPASTRTWRALVRVPRRGAAAYLSGTCPQPHTHPQPADRRAVRPAPCSSKLNGKK